MKYRRIVVSTLALTLVVFFLPAFAEESNAGIPAESNPTVVKPLKIRSDVKAEMEARRASTTLRLEEKRKEMEERRASTTNRIENRREGMLERKASSTERRIEFQQNIAKRQVEHVTKVMLATIERLEKIITRIESRIEKIKENGGETAEAEGFVVLAKGNLLDAEAAVGAFANIELSSDKAKDNFEKVRTAAREAREHIRLARENLMKAIRSLGSLKANRNATSTDESTNN
mgnify:CR=1 FL=1